MKRMVDEKEVVKDLTLTSAGIKVEQLDGSSKVLPVVDPENVVTLDTAQTITGTKILDFEEEYEDPLSHEKYINTLTLKNEEVHFYRSYGNPGNFALWLKADSYTDTIIQPGSILIGDRILGLYDGASNLTIYKDSICNDFVINSTDYHNTFKFPKRTDTPPVGSDLQLTLATTDDLPEANPTVPSGTTPTALTGLKIGSDYYSISGGGSSYTFTNGLTENSGTVSWDLNNNIIKASSGALVIPMEGQFSKNQYGIGGSGTVFIGRAEPYTLNIASSAWCNLVHACSTAGNITLNGRNNFVNSYSNANDTYLNGSISDTYGGNGMVCCLFNGSNLFASNSCETLLGHHNAIPVKDTLLLVANGANTLSRANAFLVYRDGGIDMPQLPTTDPQRAGALWNDNGTLKVSAGA